MIEEEDVKQFEFCNKVDLHALDSTDSLDTVVAVAAEHSFRGIVTTLGRLETLVKEINRPNYGSKEIVPICTIDYPYGNSSIDVRTYSVSSAKEKGAREIEVVAPYHYLVSGDFRHIYDDAQSIVAAAKRHEISLKYVIDLNSNFIDDSIRTKLCRMMQTARIPMISTSLGFFDQDIDHGDNVLKIRNVKNKVGCTVKVYINTTNTSHFAMYPKAGVDIMGVPWRLGPLLSHGYEEMVQKKN